MITSGIVYFFEWNFSANTSAALKVKDQIKIWKSKSNCNLVVVCPSQYSSEWKHDADFIFIYSNKFKRLFTRFQATKFILKQFKGNIIYRRYGIFTPTDIYLIRKIKTILEFNTNNNLYYRDRSYILFLYHKFQLLFLTGKLKGGCAVTNEIKNLQPLKIKNVTSTFTNSIDLSRVAYRKSASNGTTLNLVFLGSENFSWNGIDRLIYLAEIFPDFYFHFIGISPVTNAPSNITWIKPLYGEVLERKLAEMDIGISTLELEVLGLKEAAPLKTRTYLAAGLPIIGVSEDAGIKNCSRYFAKMKFENETSILINREEVRKFVVNSKNRVVPVKSLREINSKVVEDYRLRFILK